MKDQHRLRRLPRASRGQSLVEFAMVLPMLLVVGFIITEFGRALWIKNTITQACREAVRVASMPSYPESEKPGVCVTIAESFLDKQNMGPSSSNPAQVQAFNETVDGVRVIRVVVTRQFSFVPGGPLPTTPGGGGPFINLATITLRSEAFMAHDPPGGNAA